MTDQEMQAFLSNFYGHDGHETPTCLSEIGVYSDPALAYSKALAECKDWDEVAALVQKWSFLCQDAVTAVEVSRGKYEWRAVQHRVRASDAPEDYVDPEGTFSLFFADVGSIFLPRVMMRCSSISINLDIPWGVAFVQALRSGIIDIREGKAVLTP